MRSTSRQASVRRFIRGGTLASGSFWLLPDADEALAVRVERLAGPARPTLDGSQAGQLGHEIELGRPDISERRRVAPDPAVLEEEVVGGQALAGDVVLVEPEALGRDPERPDGLAEWQALEVRQLDLDDELTAGRQMPRDVSKAGHLGRLGRQVHDRVPDEVGEPKATLAGFHPRRREVTHRRADAVAAWLRVESAEHRPRKLDAVDLQASRNERQRHPTRADSELQHGTTVRPCGKEFDGGTE